MNDIAKLILRVVFGGLMLTHGFPKMMNLINGKLGFADPIGIGELATLILAIFAEVICAVLVIVGYKTRFSTIPLIITMIVAAFIVNAGSDLKSKETALLYLSGYVAIVLLGNGKFAITRK